MALSQITFTVVDGGLGILPPNTGNLQVTMGCCSKGIPGTFYALGSIGAIAQYLGYGTLAESMALKMASGATIQYGYVLPQTNAGSLSTVTHHGLGYGTVAVADGPNEQLTVLCTTAGAFATAKFTFAIGSGAASQPVLSGASPWAYTVPGTSTVLTFTAAGGTQSFTAGDSYTVSATGTVTAGGGNTTTNTVAQVSQPFDQYEANVKVNTTGTFTTSTFSYTLGYRTDGAGNDISTYSAPILIPSAGKYAIQNSGIYLTFAQPTILIKITTGGALGTMAFDVNVGGAGYSGSPVTSNASAATTYAVAGTNTTLTFSAATYVLNDVWTVSALGAITHTTGAGPGQPAQTSASFIAGDYNIFLAAPPSPSNGDITTAGAALIADNAHQWSIMQIATVPVTASASATLEAVADAIATAAFTAYRFIRVVMECPTLNSIVISGGLPIYDTADTDSVVTAAFASVSSAKGRTQVGAGDFDCISPITGNFQRRNAIWQEAARLNITPFSEDPGATADGSLPFTRTLYRDEAQVPALDAARLVTLRTYPVPGFYISAGPTMALVTSDFAQIMNCRVIDRGCQVAYAALFPYLRAKIGVDPSSGVILPSQKAKIEGVVGKLLRAALVASGQAVDVQFTINGSANILSTGILPCTIAITPYAYADEITVDIGFVNPALAAAAA